MVRNILLFDTNWSLPRAANFTLSAPSPHLSLLFMIKVYHARSPLPTSSSILVL
jgi:hypothetical protein